MDKNSTNCSRRRFLKIAGAAGAGALLARTAGTAGAAPLPGPIASGDPKVPTRLFGRSKTPVSILALGGMFDLAANQLMLRQALQWGVTYWDTADCYHSGSESGIGKFFSRYPQDRPKVFLVTKSDARDPEGMSRLLKRSLERMNTSYIDLYFIHAMRALNELNEDIRRWAQRAKEEGKIRLFGFSTHSNMETLLMGASELPWIDGIMLTYNYRNMHTSEMKKAVAACTNAGIGLTAMKTQAGRSWFSSETPDLSAHFMARGFTEEQARLKAVWSNPDIASLCSQMDSMKLLKANAEAAADPTPLSSLDMRLLQRHARHTACFYCAGCHSICDRAVNGRVPVNDIMRCHMYNQAYGRPEWARAGLAGITPAAWRAMGDMDFSEAERRCPNNMPIGRLMREALAAFG